jgi:hypothetical protein
VTAGARNTGAGMTAIASIRAVSQRARAGRARRRSSASAIERNARSGFASLQIKLRSRRRTETPLANAHEQRDD